MQLKYHMVTIADLVPEDHLLRQVEAALDLSFVHEETAHLYNQKYGRPAIDPVVLVKYLLLGYLCGIHSERQIEERCRDSNAFRWYLGIDLDERVSDHSQTTIILTTHNLGDIQELCQRIIIINEGKIIKDEISAAQLIKNISRTAPIKEVGLEEAKIDDIIRTVYQQENVAG